ncbi:KpsF/GutQ family sugar-phosphate isomerase [Glaciecola sp. 1036]|uniref:KpsF/GutQ family sugar-phosphate isomerase n=1 Tax=Alteromonadaceae TaxID=72275 RepID=UPI003D0279B0
MPYLESAKRTFENQIEALTHLSQHLGAPFNQACDLLLSCAGKIVVTGMGKSGHIANKIAATLASTGSPAFFMHPGEANHGDFGMLAENDVLIAISNSGETSELIALLPAIKRIKVPIVAITNNPSSTLSKFAQTTLALHVKQEACALGLAPTTSTTATLVLGDALAIALLEAKGFTAEDFAFSHPGGALGKRLLLTVEDIMVGPEDVPKSNPQDLLSDALLEISSKGLGLTTIVENDVMIGVFTDGDLRRALDKNIDIRVANVNQVMTAKGITTTPDALAVDALNIMQEKKVNALIVVNENHQPVGALNINMLLRAGVV